MIPAEQAAVRVLLAMTEAVREARRVPSGTLYALLMAQGCTLSQYTQLERILIGTGLIARRGDELAWIGPEVAS